MRTILLFPPNWSMCVSGPHLAMPLLAGAARDADWDVETWDLSGMFDHEISTPPSLQMLSSATQRNDFALLDDLYFTWEDECSSRIRSANEHLGFGLLSGIQHRDLRGSRLSKVSELIESGTAYTSFYLSRIIPALVNAAPEVIGVTISSEAQIIPAMELLRVIRIAIPEAFLILGGNIVTRLRNSAAFDVLRSRVDQIVLFQGDLAFRTTLDSVRAIGVRKTRTSVAPITSDEMIPYDRWPVPVFKGINFNSYLGIPTISYVSTRGCYWGKCHFCAIPAGWSTRGYGGSAPSEFVVNQLSAMERETGISRIKFVDEAIAPRKVREIATLLYQQASAIEWEAYARLETAWEDAKFLSLARSGGLRKLYFGMEQAPTTDRSILGKNDRGDPLRILRACKEADVKVHLFCMVGHPGSSCQDAERTTSFLLENEAVIDTADLVAFRLDRGTNVPGVQSVIVDDCDWSMSARFAPTKPGVLDYDTVSALEYLCQERLWEEAPRLLHPLYRVMSPWSMPTQNQQRAKSSATEVPCLLSCSSMP